jgi:hypothetical protein
MKYLKILFFLFLSGACCPGSSAQTVVKGFEYGEIMNISETFRQMPNISFNIVYSYTDSVRQDSIVEQISASYKIQNGKFWAMIDSTELLQGNNYNLSVFHRDSVITISPPQPVVNIMNMPFLDSLFRAQNIDSMSVTKINDSVRDLKLIFNISSQYRIADMQYDPSSYLLKSIVYYNRTSTNSTTSGSLLKINFSNYSSDIIDDYYFREDKFIYKQGGQFFGTPPYNNFQLVVNTSN